MAPPVNQKSINKVVFGKIPTTKGQRIMLYGTGGIGKTTLACLMPGPVAFVDADESLGILRSQLETIDAPIPVVVQVASFKDARTALQSEGWESIKTIVIDTATKLEEWCVVHTLATVKNDKGHNVSKIEDYGFGKGYQFVYDTFLPILADLDRHVRAGRNVVFIAHECTSNVPNPMGDDWLRYEPRLQSPKSGAGSIRLKLKEWADHVLFLGYDVAVDGKKGKGSGTRTLYCAEKPFCMAKSRTTSDQFDIELGTNPWADIIK